MTLPSRTTNLYVEVERIHACATIHRVIFGHAQFQKKLDVFPYTLSGNLSDVRFK